MARHFVTVCVFCLLCATHTPCSAHSDHDPSEARLEISHVLDIRQVKRSAPDVGHGAGLVAGGKAKRESRHRLDDAYYIEKIFSIFGNGESMSYEGFESFVKYLHLDAMLSSKFQQSAAANASGGAPGRLRADNVSCVGGRELVRSASLEGGAASGAAEPEPAVDAAALRRLCPVLLYQMVAPSSVERHGCIIGLSEEHGAEEGARPHAHAASNAGSVWLYSTLSITIISTCGLLGVLVIPIMQQHFYQHLIQFLVALAVGTLSGDALLHLLPHAMMGGAEHDGHDHLGHPGLQHGEPGAEDPHARNMWRGFVAMIGLIFFFFMEKCLTLGAEWRKQRQLRKNKVPTRVRIMREPDTTTTNAVGEKLCKHKYSSYPYCYDKIATETHGDELNNKPLNNAANNANIEIHISSAFAAKPPAEANQNLSRCTSAADALKCSESNKMLADAADARPDELAAAAHGDSYTVILREHENKHHGHSHTHGHVHSAPKSMSSVAWMVIMGDGLHNFTDGMAIGAAFAGSLAGGFSTAVAVFCHELPHEIGDFAVLLKAGMTAKQAVFYNMLSSVLCLFGMVLGVFLGNSQSASSWIFACAAGMFLYIALVDMIPELTTSHSKEGGSFLQCGLQFMGMLTGLGIMMLIALYEHDLKTLFED